MIELLLTAVGTAVTVGVPLAGWVLKIQSRVAVAENDIAHLKSGILTLETRIIDHLRRIEDKLDRKADRE